MTNVLITGMPRSGTTLATFMMNHQPNVIALAEPFGLSREWDRKHAVEQIIGLMREYRATALARGALITKHVDGKIPENWVEPPQDSGRLRRVLEQRGPLTFNKPLSDDFTLVVKHPAEFTALADLLVTRVPLFAIIRDPLAVMAAWQTVDMPVQRGRMPMLESFAPDNLKARLDSIDDPLDRQVELLAFQMRTYLSLGMDRIIRYEDLVTDPQKALAQVCALPVPVPEHSAYDPQERYKGVDFPRLAARLLPILPLIEEFYPDFRQRWPALLPSKTVVAGTSVIDEPSRVPRSAGPGPGDEPRVFVMGAYIAAGGTHMAYEIGRVAKQRLGLSCYAVTWENETAGNSVFDYPDHFECVTRDELATILRPQDILICNPSFSDGLVGLSHHCRKLMYVQGFNSFRTLDLWFDRHIAVGGFTRDFLANVYGLEAPIINPFITTDHMPLEPWWSRPANSIWFYLKGDGQTQLALLKRLRQEISNIDPVAAAGIDWDGSMLWSGKYKQRALFAKIAERRHLITLSVCEGFGLVPLEAMAMSLTVLGFDGFGGREYMRRGVNCLVRSSPDLTGVAQDVLDCLKDPDSAAALAANGPATAALYSRARFEESWEMELQAMLQR